MPSRRPHGDDGGFTLVEVLVAMAVISTALLGLVLAQLQSLSTITVAKQRQQATALATQTMERVRSLDYAKVLLGLSSTDLADPNITDGRLRPSFDASIDEPVLSTVTSDTTAPLRPHVRADASTFLNGVQYTVRTYVTRAGADVNLSGVNLTVAVTWASTASAGTKIAVQRSRIYQVAGCSGDTLRAFSGPCQTFLYGQAGSGSGSIDVRPGGTATSLLPGSSVTTGKVTLPVVSALAQAEQLVSGSATATTSGASTAAGSLTSGSVAAVSSARTDPETGPASDGPHASTQTGGPLVATGTAGTLTLRPGAGDTTSVLSVPSASAAPACTDTSPTPLVVTSGQLCSSASASTPASAGLSLDLGPVGGRDLPATDLVQLPQTTRKGWTGRYTAAGATHCAAATAAGCIAATAAQTMAGTAQLGQLPATSSGDAAPPGFQGYLARLSGLSATAWSESGTGSANPSPTTPYSDPTARWSRQGTISYWTGSSYGSLSVATDAALADVPLPEVAVTYAGTPAVTIRALGTLQVTAPGSTTEGTAPCAAAACSRTSTSGAIRAQLHYVISDASSAVPTADFWVDVDLGSASATTTYRAAP